MKKIFGTLKFNEEFQLLLGIIIFCQGLSKRVTIRTIYLSTRYKGGNYSTLKLEDVTTSNIKGEITFFSHNYFLLVNYYVFFTLNNVLKKVSPKKTIRKTMNFGSTNWLNQKLYVFYLKWCIKKKKINPRKLYVKQ